MNIRLDRNQYFELAKKVNSYQYGFCSDLKYTEYQVYVFGKPVFAIDGYFLIYNQCDYCGSKEVNYKYKTCQKCGASLERQGKIIDTIDNLYERIFE